MIEMELVKFQKTPSSKNPKKPPPLFKEGVGGGAVIYIQQQTIS
jgi:hypothetical protein